MTVMSNNHNELRAFGKFRLDVKKKTLFLEKEIVSLPLKEIELLCLLTESNEVISKNEILERLWTDTVVEESNLSAYIYRLRKFLAKHGESEDLIKTVPKIGYRWTGEVKTISDDSASETKSEIEEIPGVPQVYDEEKNPFQPIAEIPPKPKTGNWQMRFLAGLVVIAGVLVYYIYAGAFNKSEKIKSIAVLPLKSLDDSDNKPLRLGFADALITSLGKLDELNVVSTDTISRYADGSQIPLEIGKDLNVDAVLEGTLQRANGKLRVTWRLIRISDGKQIWNKSFDESENEIFRLQDKMAIETAETLNLNLNPQTREAILKKYTQNQSAYLAYQNGRGFFFTGDMPAAAAEFEKALKLEENYALAYSGLADTYARMANGSDEPQKKEFYEKAKFYALKALTLDENLAETHASIGWIYRIYDWNWQEAEKHLRRSVELAPNNAFHKHQLAFLYITLGRTKEAVELGTEAKMLDPLSHSNAWNLFCDRRFEESAAEYQRMQKSAKKAEGDLGLAMAYSELGKQAEAAQTIEEAFGEKKNFAAKAILAIISFRTGEVDKSLQILSELEKEAAGSPRQLTRLAHVYAVMNKKEEALSTLEKALEQRDDRLMWIKTIPYFDNLRSEPRFRKILEKMNLQ